MEHLIVINRAGYVAKREFKREKSIKKGNSKEKALKKGIQKRKKHQSMQIMTNNASQLLKCNSKGKRYQSKQKQNI